ncbi:hypothetical protein CONPUDRAFT_154694 [Coniophora puteana RWD-64-598 SS2]|uniref:Uncharacterized protein n=1 Tax=Coniophora puteana (strain RWD-64-598) TaxID=741705 RepID=A0A5M3MNU1_CONPW|nr:uncharacterized protein CONPUDRAFT_154694 [Coniophora puteana RWD-64-598 SS2]EIW80680.1 hypothetical protein CONPUDRAFT_154694 [Coniophora puteana RWD-64-598 SS2]
MAIPLPLPIPTLPVWANSTAMDGKTAYYNIAHAQAFINTAEARLQEALPHVDEWEHGDFVNKVMGEVDQAYEPAVALYARFPDLMPTPVLFDVFRNRDYVAAIANFNGAADVDAGVYATWRCANPEAFLDLGDDRWWEPPSYPSPRAASPPASVSDNGRGRRQKMACVMIEPPTVRSRSSVKRAGTACRSDQGSNGNDDEDGPNPRCVSTSGDNGPGADDGVAAYDDDNLEEISVGDPGSVGLTNKQREARQRTLDRLATYYEGSKRCSRCIEKHRKCRVEYDQVICNGCRRNRKRCDARFKAAGDDGAAPPDKRPSKRPRSTASKQPSRSGASGKKPKALPRAPAPKQEKTEKKERKEKKKYVPVAQRKRISIGHRSESQIRERERKSKRDFRYVTPNSDDEVDQLLDDSDCSPAPASGNVPNPAATAGADPLRNNPSATSLSATSLLSMDSWTLAASNNAERELLRLLQRLDSDGEAIACRLHRLAVRATEWKWDESATQHI